MTRTTPFVLMTFAFCVGLMAIQFTLLDQWLVRSKERDRHMQIRQEILRLERLVADVDNGFRGYVLMKQSGFLRPMVAAEGTIPGVVEELTRLTEDRPELQGGVQVLNDRVTELVDVKRRLTMDLQLGQEETVLAYIKGGEGLALANTIALAFQDLDRRLREQQREWDQDTAKRTGWVRWGLPLTALGGVACGIGIGRTTGRSRTDMCTHGSPHLHECPGNSQEVRDRVVI